MLVNMADELQNTSQFFRRFRIPPDPLDAQIPRPGPYLFHSVDAESIPTLQVTSSSSIPSSYSTCVTLDKLSPEQRKSNKAVQNSSFAFIAVHRPIPKVSLTVLYESPVANLQRATATRFSTEIASRRIVFCRASPGPTSAQMCSKVSLLALKCSYHRSSW